MKNESSGEYAFIYTAANATSVVVSLLATLSVCTAKLYKKTVYRLALYQVLSSLLFSAQFTIQFLIFDKPTKANMDMCKAFAFFDLYCGWMKLLFTACVTFHLFRFVVFYKDPKKLEPYYVAFSLIVPALVASVPLVLHGYGPQGFVCWIQMYSNGSSNRDGVIEAFALWYVPSMLLLVFVSLTMLVTVVILAHRAYFRHSWMRSQNTKALKQLLPLAAFPILYLVFSVPLLLNYVLHNVTDSDFNMKVIDAACVIGWSLSAGVTVMGHIVVTGLCSSMGICTRWCTRRRVVHVSVVDYGSMHEEAITKSLQNGAAMKS